MDSRLQHQLGGLICQERILDWKSTRSDPDVWFRPATTDDGFKVYQYLLVYVDDLLAGAIDSFFKLKPGSIAKPTTFLGANIGQHYLKGDTKGYWSMGSAKYVAEAVNNVKQWLQEWGLQMKLKLIHHYQLIIAQNRMYLNYSTKI